MTDDEIETLTGFADRIRRNGVEGVAIGAGIRNLVVRGLKNTDTFAAATAIRNAFPHEFLKETAA